MEIEANKDGDKVEDVPKDATSEVRKETPKPESPPAKPQEPDEIVAQFSRASPVVRPRLAVVTARTQVISFFLMRSLETAYQLYKVRPGPRHSDNLYQIKKATTQIKS